MLVPWTTIPRMRSSAGMAWRHPNWDIRPRCLGLRDWRIPSLVFVLASFTTVVLYPEIGMNNICVLLCDSAGINDTRTSLCAIVMFQNSILSQRSSDKVNRRDIENPSSPFRRRRVVPLQVETMRPFFSGCSASF